MRKFMLLGILTILFPFALSAQNIKVSGKVLDANTNEALVGVTVVQTGTQNGTITDLDGNFTLDNVASDASLSFSYIGYVTETIFVNGKSTIVCNLKTNDKEIDEVVVVGYGTAKKSDVSGSLVSVNTKDMMKRAPQNINQGLQGVAAGVQVTAQDGAPDGRSQVRIRGVATINGDPSPLYVVDGIQVGTNADFLNPSDIERIEVLKDASATSIYGAAGANGVIMITTKQGTKGATHVTFSADLGVQTLPYKLDVLDVDAYAQMFRTAQANDGNKIVNEIWTEKYDGQRKAIDWQDELTRLSLRQQYNLSVSGGTDKTQSQFSVGWLDNKGIIVNSYYKRLTARGNVRSKVTDFLEIGGDVSFVHNESNGSNTAIGNNGNLSSLRDLAFMCPTMDYVDPVTGQHISPNVENPNGTYGGVYHGNDGSDCIKDVLDNPYAIQMQNNGSNYDNRVLTTANIKVNIVKGLTFTSISNYNFSTTGSNNHSGQEERWNYDANGNLYKMPRSNADLKYKLSYNQSQYNSLSIENYFNYNLKREAFALDLMAGQSANKQWGAYLNSSASSYAAGNLRQVSLTQDPTSKQTDGNLNLETRGISYYGRANFNVLERYILTATIRRDGSSNFGEGNRWGNFPSVAFAWRASQESFLADNDFISNLKLRLSWGQNGNSGGATSKCINSLTAGEKYSYYTLNGGMSYSSNGTLNTGYAFNLNDSNLKWETTTETNIGIDLGLLQGQFNFSIDYYVKNTTDLLIDRTIRASSGYSQIYTNYGEIENKGLDFSISWNKQINDWNFNAMFTGSTLKNKVIKMGQDITKENQGIDYAHDDHSNVGAVGDPSGYYWNRHSMTREGEAIGSYWGYKVIGIAKTQEQVDALNAQAIANGQSGYLESGTLGVGDYIYEDVDGDGWISSEDQQILGNGFPKFTYGITLNVAYKNFDFNFYGYGQAGLELYSYSAMRLSNIFYSDDQTVANLLVDSYNDIWSPENPNGTLSRLSLADKARNMRGSSMWVKKADFFKIGNIQLGYTLPKDVISHLKMTNARVYFSIQNVATFSKYKKYGDPECGIGNPVFTGLDTGRYPNPRTFQFGVNFTF